MNYKTRYFLLLTVVLWPFATLLYVIMDSVIAGGNLTGQTGFKRILITAAISLALTLFGNLLTFLFNPASKARANIMAELENTGLSDSLIRLAEAEVNRLISTGKVYKYYRPFHQYTTLIANAYLNRWDIPTALEKLNTLTLNEMQAYLKNPNDNSLFLGYFDLYMVICEKTNDPDRADNVLQIAAPYLAKAENSITTDKLLFHEIYCYYHLVHDDIGSAMEHANKCFALGNSENILFIGNALNSKCCIRAKNFDKALEYINRADNVSKKGLFKQIAGSLRYN